MISQRIMLCVAAIFCLFASGYAITEGNVTAEGNVTTDGNVTIDGNVTVVVLNAENSTATLDCQTTDDKVVWKHNGTMDTTKPQIEVSGKSAVGTYICTATREDPKTFKVVYLGKTLVEQGHRSLNFNNGEEDRSIVCTNSDSIPSVTFTWYYRKEGEEGKGVNLSGNKDYAIENTEINSTLTFLNLTYESRGLFTCEGSNDIGSSSAEIMIRVKDRLAALWPFLGIVLEVIILIIVIFIYEKRSKKAVEQNNVVRKDEAVPLKGDESDDIRLRTRNNNSK